MSGAALVATDAGDYQLKGELDFTSVVTLLRLPEQLLADVDEPRIDLSGVRHANSAGLALLVEWLGQARSRGRTLRFTHLPDSLLRLAELSNLEAMIGVEPSSGEQPAPEGLAAPGNRAGTALERGRHG